MTHFIYLRKKSAANQTCIDYKKNLDITNFKLGKKYNPTMVKNGGSIAFDKINITKMTIRTTHGG